MANHRPSLTIGLLGLALVGLSSTLSAAEAKEKLSNNYNILLWEDGKVPLARGNGPLDKPFITVFMPPEGKKNGASVVIGPGGSNIMLMYGAEGIDIAERYNEWGVTAFVLTYRMCEKGCGGGPRVPRSESFYGQDARVADAKRAIQVVRSRAKDWSLDPTKVGYIGFSAGSNFGTQLVAESTPGDPNAADPIDRLSSRPDYLALVYGPGRTYPADVFKTFPPVFLVVAQGDRGNAVNSARLFTELTQAGAIAELHIYQQGHHGFGSGFADPNTKDWMGRLKHFLEYGGLLPGGKQ